MDLDQKAMEGANANFSAAGFINGKKIYSEGGNTETFATLTLGAQLPVAVTVGTIVTGFTNATIPVSGFAYEAAALGSSTLKVRYATGAAVLQCSVGGLQKTNTTGCMYIHSYIIELSFLFIRQLNFDLLFNNR